jgi:deoxyadenosine/deoxycytidine kinase
MENEMNTRMPSWINYLCVEGVIGAGKTSFCNLLAQEFSARQVLETAEENPFLEEFYRNRRSYAFQTQMWFLVSRYKQLSETIAQQDLFHPLTVSDYIFAKDRIFASVNLDEEELILYEHVAGVMVKNIPPPDLVIYLQTSTGVLLQRIERRGRSFEFNMDPRYIDLLNEAYNHFFFHYNETPLLIVNTNELDFVNVKEDFSELIGQIMQMNRGTRFYQPMTKRDRSRIQGRAAAETDDREIPEEE